MFFLNKLSSNFIDEKKVIEDDSIKCVAGYYPHTWVPKDWVNYEKRKDNKNSYK